ncbi:MAG: GNAT family N-acetyltransferase [Acidobacteria bacterium]|nr:GNAT family N-acetyltransferase [Acidobacteriota bacterium]
MTPAAALAPTAVPPTAAAPVALRTAHADDADAIHALIVDHLAEGHLLPRERDEIAVHAHRFVVATTGGGTTGSGIVACAELAPLSRDVSEVRSLVVCDDARALGVGHHVIDELVERASTAGFEKLCAFTHAPAYFVRFGFSIVPHVWLPEKILADCRTCEYFRRCGQYAMLRELRRSPQTCVPLAALHG